jgi:hypothetical protein
MLRQMSGHSKRAGIRAFLLGVVLSLAVTAGAEASPAPTIAAAGDIACGSNNPRFNGGGGTPNSCQQLLTSNLMVQRPLSAVLPLGDLAYDQNGSLESFLTSYEPTWGRLRAISHPVIGNHEYDDGLGAQGYWDYWDGVGAGDGPAGVRGRGWYSFDLGSWHLVALNSNCDYVSCLGSSRQLRWLRNDLHEHRQSCVLAYMHHPRFSSGLYEELGDTRALWRALYRGRADVVLNGHDHLYERFAPQRPSGILDTVQGISQFTVGTGGYFLFPIIAPVTNSEFAYNQAFGVLFMTLGEKQYGWSFVNVFGQTVDHGKRGCTRAEPPRRRRHRHGGGKNGNAASGRPHADAPGRRSG